MILFVHIIAGFFSTIAFGVLTNVPRRALLASGITGCIGWLIYVGIHTNGGGLGVANFFAAFVIGCFSIFFPGKNKSQ